MRLHSRCGHAIIAASLTASTVMFAQQGTADAPVPDLGGGWVRLDDAGSGSFSGLADTLQQAALTAAAAANLARPPQPSTATADQRPRREGEAYIVTEGRCGFNAGALEPNSAAFFMAQTDDEVLIVKENPGARHIYMDGRTHPDLSRWTPSGIGHSTGRYENGMLVVETIGLAPGAVTAGGWRTPETVLVERYRLSADGKNMTISYTWTDPKVYLRPHVYELQFERLPGDSYAFENWCDSGDPRQRESVVPPRQL